MMKREEDKCMANRLVHAIAQKLASAQPDALQLCEFFFKGDKRFSLARKKLKIFSLSFKSQFEMDGSFNRINKELFFQEMDARERKG